MDGELMMMLPGYGPFIHTGGRNTTGKKDWHQPHPATFGLWATLDGVLTYSDGPNSLPLRLPGPTAIVVSPGNGHTVSLPAGSQWYYLRFDVVDQPRCRLPGKRAWQHSEAVVQPSPQAIWGIDLPLHVPDHCIANTIQLLRDCCALWWRNDSFHAQSNAALGHWLMNYINLHQQQAALTATGNGFHQQCRDLIHERLSLSIDVADLAAACGYSRVHFSRRFRAETGMHPSYFIREERMAHASHLLISTQLGLKEVATQCGYRSVAAFSRSFAAQHGSAPGTWRRKFR